MASQRRLDQYFSQSKRKREEVPTKRRKLNDDCADRDFTEESCTQRKQKKAISLQIDKSIVADGTSLVQAAKRSPLFLNAPVPAVADKIKLNEDSANVEAVSPDNPPKRKRIVAESLEIKKKGTDTQNSQSQLQLDAKRQTLDAVAMKEKLAKCGKLAELQERLAKLRKSSASLQSSKKVQETQLKNKSVSTELDNAAGEKISTNKNIPAYQRFHHLASADAATNLTLPYKYKLLDEVFHSVDTVISMLHNRQELCTFSKLKPAVQEMLRKTLEMRHMGQLKTVFPIAYIFGKTTLKNNVQDITVAPNLNLNTVGDALDNNGNFNERPELVGHSQQETQRMSPSLLLVRRNIFHSRLLELVKEHHDSFLRSLDPPINLPKDSITRWHPKFRVDEVPDLEESELPVLDNSNKCATATEVFQKVKGLYGPKIENALRTTAAKLEANNLHTVDVNVNVAPQAKVNANLKGIPLSLLQKIRAKEAEKLKREMTRDAKVDRKLAMISRLAEIARILRVYFISEKKAAITIDEVIQKLEDSFQTALPQGEVKEHVLMLAEIAPMYLTVVTVRNAEYVKVNKQIDLNAVAERIFQAKKSLV